MPEIALSFISLALMAAASLGAGTAALRLAGADVVLSQPARRTSAFVLGLGILGWLAFPLALMGWLGQGTLILLCLILALGLILERPSHAGAPDAPHPVTAWTRILVLAIGVVLFLDFLEGLAPPADADSLLYHFGLPRLFLSEGKIVFVPRVVDGAVPLLQHMSYTVALGIGGERAMTLWTMLTGWGAAGALYALARGHLSRDWSLALALLFLTMPAVIYGAGAGQVEVRSAAFVLVAALAIMEARRLDSVAFAALAGLAAGFYAASKYPGLLFLPLAGLAVIAQRRWLRHGLAFSAAALATAAPFYLWHWWNTGDPFFPALFGIVEYRPGVPWTADYHAEMRQLFEVSEKAVPATALWALAYPFLATFGTSPTFESSRTGFGPFVLMILPIALAGIWVRRRIIARSPLWTPAFLTAGFYFTWFLFGPSQRARHLLPVYPLLLLCIGVAAVRSIEAWRFTAKPVIAGFGLVLAFQFAVHTVFSINSARYLFGGESREAYLRRNVGGYDAAVWINAHLRPGDRLLFVHRQLAYFLPANSFYAHHAFDARVDIRPSAGDVGRFWDELAIEGITHLLVPVPDPAAPREAYLDFAHRLAEMGCARELTRLETASFGSRTIAQATRATHVLAVLTLDPGACPLEKGLP